MKGHCTKSRWGLASAIALLLASAAQAQLGPLPPPPGPLQQAQPAGTASSPQPRKLDGEPRTLATRPLPQSPPAWPQSFAIRNPGGQGVTWSLNIGGPGPVRVDIRRTREARGQLHAKLVDAAGRTVAEGRTWEGIVLSAQATPANLAAGSVWRLTLTLLPQGTTPNGVSGTVSANHPPAAGP
jgi:hypothetical protein